jgi:hypothetical protein
MNKRDVLLKIRALKAYNRACKKVLASYLKNDIISMKTFMDENVKLIKEYDKDYKELIKELKKAE